MRLRPLNTSRREQLDEHSCLVGSALSYHDRQYEDRHGDGPIQRINARLHAMGPSDDNLPSVPERFELASSQGVKIFAPITMADTVHPDAREFFAADELDAVIDEAFEKPLLTADCYRHFDYVGAGSEHAGMLGFQSEAQEKGEIEHQKKVDDRNAKLMRRAKAAGYKVEHDLADPVDEAERIAAAKEAKKWSELAKSLKAEIRDRYRYGFFHKGGKAVAGDHYDPFCEYFGENVLRSHLGSPSLARFAQIVPKARRMRVGADKEALLSTSSKVMGLDAPYVEFDRKRACAVVVELDTVWQSAAALWLKLLEILPIHMMPNLIVARYTRDGLFARPHLIWLLKPGAEVWTDLPGEWTDDDGVVHGTGDKRCKKRPVKFFRAVQRALTALLIPVGADPACRNVWKPKNPLSPFWTTVVANDDYWPILKDFLTVPGFDLAVDEHAMAEQAATMRGAAAGATSTTSNLAWKVTGNVIEPLVRMSLATREPAFIAAGQAIDTLAAWLEAKVRPIVEAEIGPSAGLDRVLSRRCLFAARYCHGKTGKPRRKRNKGRDRDVFFEVDTPKNRKKAAGMRSAAHRRAMSVYNLRKEITVALWTTGAVTKTDFIKTVDTVSKSTAYECWDEAIDGMSVEFRDGHHV